MSLRYLFASHDDRQIDNRDVIQQQIISHFVLLNLFMLGGQCNSHGGYQTLYHGLLLIKNAGALSSRIVRLHLFDFRITIQRGEKKSQTRLHNDWLQIK